MPQVTECFKKNYAASLSKLVEFSGHRTGVYRLAEKSFPKKIRQEVLNLLHMEGE